MDWRELDANPKRLEQLSLGLNLEEIQSDESKGLSADEVKRRSEVAEATLKAMLNEEKITWAEDFKMLMSSGWPWRIAVYVAWASSPKNTRWPENQEKLAQDVLGLTSDRQIATWRSKNPAIDQTITLLQAAPILQHRRDVFEALVNSAMNDDYKHHPDRKLFLEMTGDYRPRTDVNLRRMTTTPDDLADLSVDELRELAQSAINKMEEDASNGEENSD